MRKILIIGATSVIATQAARCFAAQGDAFVLVGRNIKKLAALGSDLTAIGAKKVENISIHFEDATQCADTVRKAEELLHGIDIALVAQGILPDQKACEMDSLWAEEAFRINFLSVLYFLVPLSEIFEKRRAGHIAVITSVAGDRGRESNYFYGSAKGALTIVL